MFPPGLLARLRPPYQLRYVYERQLGTELEVQVIAATRPQAEAAETAALNELDRLSAVLNRFNADSELRRWQQSAGQPTALSAELRRVLELADRWRIASGGAFHPGADALGAHWQAAASTGQVPPADTLAATAAALRSPPWTLHPDGAATLHALYPLGLNALAKGFIVDRMAETARAQPGVQAVLINAGGDLRTLGGRGVTVAVADPLNARDDAPPLGRVRVRDAALATSGQAHRGYRVGETWYSHVLDPSSGQPVTAAPGVMVTAPDCATADALATVLSVTADKGLSLVDATPGAAALIVAPDGFRCASQRWPADF